MPDLLRQGSAMLHRVRRESVSHEVLYRRGTGEDAVELTLAATVSVTRTERIDQAGGSSIGRYRDFCFETAAMLIDDQAFDPRPGDVIVEVNGELTEKFEAVMVGGEPCFRREGMQNESTRVHTVRIGAES